MIKILDLNKVLLRYVHKTEFNINKDIREDRKISLFRVSCDMNPKSDGLIPSEY